MVSARAVPITHVRTAITSSPAEDVFSGRMLNSFCCKCTLRTGTLCCGVFSLVLSTFGIITNRAIDIGNYLNYERSLMFLQVLTFVVSVFCIHGALKEYRYSLLAWLLVTAFITIVLFLIAIYLILFGIFKAVIIGLHLLIFACICVYGWMNVASYYTQLKERNVEESHAPTRNYIDPAAVTNPAAFSTPPPPAYNVAVGVVNPAFDEKPPSYEEAESSKQSGGRQQMEQPRY